MDDLIIETKRLTKIYGEQAAVNAVDLHVKKGRIFGLLGRNGAEWKTDTSVKEIRKSLEDYFR